MGRPLPLRTIARGVVCSFNQPTTQEVIMAYINPSKVRMLYFTPENICSAEVESLYFDLMEEEEQKEFDSEVQFYMALDRVI